MVLKGIKFVGDRSEGNIDVSFKDLGIVDGIATSQFSWDGGECFSACPSNASSQIRVAFDIIACYRHGVDISFAMTDQIRIPRGAMILVPADKIGPYL